MIAVKAEVHAWPLLAYPKKLKLPTDIYQALPTNSEVNVRQSQSYLTDAERETLRASLLKRHRSYKPPKVINGDTQAPRKRLSGSPKVKSSAKKRKKEKSKNANSVSERRTSTRIKTLPVYKDIPSNSEASSNDEHDGSDSSEQESDSEGDV